MTKNKPVTELATALQAIEATEIIVEKELVVFDLDQTLIANEGIRYAEEGYFTAASHRSLIREVRKQEARKMVKVVFATAREEKYRKITKTWLKKRQLGHIDLYMVSNGTPVQYAGQRKAQKVAKVVREGNFTSVRMYEDNKGFLTSVKNTLKPLKIPLTKIHCSHGKMQEID